MKMSKMLALLLYLCGTFELTYAQQPVPLRAGEINQYCDRYDTLNNNGLGQCIRWFWNVGACWNPRYCMCDASEENFVRGSRAQEYCSFLLQDTPDSWKYPFRGRHPNPPDDWTTTRELNYRCSAFTYCLAFLDNPAFPSQPKPGLPNDIVGGRANWFRQIFRFTTFNDFRRPTRTQHENDPRRVTDNHKRINAEMRAQVTNRLKFTDQTIAQEGISFCIAGRHLKRSPMASMDSLRAFLPLIERSFDIGNHINPSDSSQMNRFDLSQHHKGFFSRLLPAADRITDFDDDIKNWNLDNDQGVPRHEYENVFMGFTAFHFRNFDDDGTRDPINPNQDLELNTGFMTRPAHLDYQPGTGCRNPYRVQVTTIESDGKPLHNYLHIKVFSEDVGNPTGQRCPTGKMRLMMLEVRDENGYPVGEFTDEIPCDKDEATLNAQLRCAGNGACRRWTGTKANQVPCMFTHPQSTVHPSIFMVSASDTLSGGGGGGINNAGPGGIPAGQGQPGGGGTNAQHFCRDSTKPVTAVPNVQNNDDYFSEIHATWRFAQMNNRWTKELHFATLIIEDDSPIQYYTGRKTVWQGPDSPHDYACRQFKHPVERENPLQTHGPLIFRCDAGFTYFDLIDRWVGREVKKVHEPWCCTTLSQGRFNCDDTCSKPEDIQPRIIYDDTNACYFWWPFRSTWARGGVYHLALLNRCVDEHDNTNRPYGYSARYTVLKPTFRTLGGWDHFQKRFVAPEVVNCHVDITSGERFEFSTTEFGKLPLRPSLKDHLDNEYRLEHTQRYAKKNKLSPVGPPPYPLPATSDPYRNFGFWNRWHREFIYCDENVQFSGLRHVPNVYELSDWHSIGVSKSQSTEDFDQMLQFTYFARTAQSGAKKMFRSAHQDPILLRAEFPDEPAKEYFGSEHLLCPENLQCPPEKVAVDLQRSFDLEQQYSLQEMADRSRCPCPFIPTTPPPELQTKTDLEIDGRQLHVINTLFAWMVLVPLAFFVARFYKETFCKVFFLQEFWWYTIHVLTLLTALLFTFGGIYGMRLKRDADYVLVWTNTTAVHIYTGYVLIGLFVVHLCIGPFRLYNPEWRKIQIALHWGIGWVEYSLALVVTLSATGIPTGMMNCVAFGVYCAFIFFQIAVTIGMELHMRLVVDKELALDPPREYMPPPMMRLFHRDAPHSKCRIVMLVVFVVGCFTFYGLMHTFIHLDGGETGCFQPKAANSSSQP